MATFEEVRLSWNGKDLVIPPNDVLRAIAKVEDVLTLGDLAGFTTKGRLPLAKLAQSFGILLRHAGAQVSDDEVYNGMFTGGGRELQRRAFAAVAALQALMVPPEHLRAEPAKGPPGKAAGARRAAPSRKPTSS